VGHDFRTDSLYPTHTPEFTMLQASQAYAD